VEFPRGLACRSRCEEDVRDVIELVQRNLKFTQAVVSGAPQNRVAMLVVATFIILFGLLFVAISILGDRLVWPLLGLGALIAAYGVFMMVRVFRFRPPV